MNLGKIIKKPIISEKSVSEQAQFNRYTFKVAKKASKGSIANAAKEMFDVEVTDVKTMIIPGKKKRVKGTFKFSKGADWKKAVITVADGQKIAMFNELLGEGK
jgi:large subunit ribosomal protein L23